MTSDNDNRVIGFLAFTLLFSTVASAIMAAIVVLLRNA